MVVAHAPLRRALLGGTSFRRPRRRACFCCLEVRPYERCSKAPTELIKGAWTCPHPGVATLTWHNDYSRWHAKHVAFKATVVSPGNVEDAKGRLARGLEQKAEREVQKNALSRAMAQQSAEAGGAGAMDLFCDMSERSSLSSGSISEATRSAVVLGNDRGSLGDSCVADLDEGYGGGSPSRGDTDLGAAALAAVAEEEEEEDKPRQATQQAAAVAGRRGAGGGGGLGETNQEVAALRKEVERLKEALMDAENENMRLRGSHKKDMERCARCSERTRCGVGAGQCRQVLHFGESCARLPPQPLVCIAAWLRGGCCQV